MELVRKSPNRPCLSCVKSRTFTATTFSSLNTTRAGWRSSAGARHCPRRRSMLVSPLTPCCWAPSAHLISTGFLLIKNPRPGCFCCDGHWAALRIYGRSILFARWRGRLHCAAKLSRGPISQNGSSSAFNTMRYTVNEIERVARIAFAAATRRLGKVTSVDKANVLETSQLWRQTVSRVALEYPQVDLDHLYVDAAAMHIITTPRRFDVILTENLFGDILSDEASVISGSLGMLASATVGGAVDLYEPVHGSAPDIAGKGIANPLGAIASAAMLLRHTARLEDEAADIEAAIQAVLDAGYRTADIARGTGGRLISTTEMGQLVLEATAEVADMRHAYHAV